MLNHICYTSTIYIYITGFCLFGTSTFEFWAAVSNDIFVCIFSCSIVFSETVLPKCADQIWDVLVLL